LIFLYLFVQKGDHLYTLDKDEMSYLWKMDYKLEGSMGFAAPPNAPGCGGANAPVRRFFNPTTWGKKFF
jgi:hypothetical protein